MEEQNIEKPAGLMPRNRLPKSLSVVLPCYNEEEVLEELRNRVSAVLSEFDFPYEILFVDDGSADRTWEMLCEYQQADPHIKAVRLSRNCGHQLAFTCGVDNARGEVVVIMDADLQDPPELLNEMLAKWQEGYDVVYGKRRKREGESIPKRFFAFAFYRLIARLTKIEIPQDTGDFRLMDRNAINALCSLRESQRFIRGMVSWIGFHQAAVEYDRPQRFAGDVKYTFRKSFILAIDAITSFSFAPLRLATVLGLGLSAFSLMYIVVVLGLNILGRNLPGYTSLMAAVLLLGGVQLIVLGVIGEYVGRIFEQTKMRPLYFVDQIRGKPQLEAQGER